jgi:hypothetical protein
MTYLTIFLMCFKLWVCIAYEVELSYQFVFSQHYNFFNKYFCCFQITQLPKTVFKSSQVTRSSKALPIMISNRSSIFFYFKFHSYLCWTDQIWSLFISHIKMCLLIFQIFRNFLVDLKILILEFYHVHNDFFKTTRFIDKLCCWTKVIESQDFFYYKFRIISRVNERRKSKTWKLHENSIDISSTFSTP